MVISDIPTIAQLFLKKYIQSVWQLELVRFLKSGGKDYTLEEISKSLYLSADVIKSGLNYFEKAGLVKSKSGEPKTYCYAPSDNELARGCDEALKSYNERRVQVINIIFSAPIQTFADAFKFRREEE